MCRFHNLLHVVKRNSTGGKDTGYPAALMPEGVTIAVPGCAALQWAERTLFAGFPAT